MAAVFWGSSVPSITDERSDLVLVEVPAALSEAVRGEALGDQVVEHPPRDRPAVGPGHAAEHGPDPVSVEYDDILKIKVKFHICHSHRFVYSSYQSMTGSVGRGKDRAAADFSAYLNRRGYSVETQRHRMGIVYRWRAFVGPDWPAATFRDVERFAASLEVKPSSQRAHLSHLSAFYRWARREGLASANPVELVDLPKVPRRLPRPADDVAIAAVIRHAGPDVAAMVALMATAGLRCCEVAALDWADVNLLRDEAVVHGKGGHDRLAYLSPDCVRLLARLDGVDGPVFTSPSRGGRYKPHRISQLVNETFKACGHAVTAHQLRHRAATEALAGAQGDLLAVRDMLGHASVATTQQYTQIASRRTAQVARAVPLPR